MRMLSIGVAVLVLLGGLQGPVMGQELEAGSVKSDSPVAGVQGYSWKALGYQFQARSRDANGLYRDVQVEAIEHKNFKGSVVHRSVITAKYARTEPGRAGTWVLGKGFSRAYDKNGSQVSEARFDRLIIGPTKK